MTGKNIFKSTITLIVSIIGAIVALSLFFALIKAVVNLLGIILAIVMLIFCVSSITKCIDSRKM